MFQQHHDESFSKAWTRFKDLLQKVPHHGIDLWLQVQIFNDHVNQATRNAVNHSAGGKLRDKSIKESWELIEDLALYDNESWNDPRDFVKTGQGDLFASRSPEVMREFDPIISFQNEKNGLLEEAENVLGLADGSKSYPIGIMRNTEVYVGKLKLLEDFYIIDMKKDPTCPLLVGRGFLATASVVIDSKKSKIAVGEGITRSYLELEKLATVMRIRHIGLP
uniref:Zinc finger, CCHC-type n=1 Tax=Tanacetum cinerariifolium TaxID=118510 RepID=A0A699JCN0_TANCI|nr:zinc finger, CCHC-type [Tanacetum cinerariifolium]